MICRAISLHQPWATLMALKIKWEETRGWGTDYRGPLVVHAALTKEWLDPHKLAPEIMAALEKHGLTLEKLPLGGYVCAGELKNCYPVWEATHDDQKPFGNYGPDRFVWLVDGVVAFDPFIPARGYQNWWSVDYDGKTVRKIDREDPKQIKLL